jgi:hypothetical protein
MIRYNKISIILFILTLPATGWVAGQDGTAVNMKVMDFGPFATIPPPQYESFKPPAAGEWFEDLAFGTPIKRLTDEHNIIGWNGERAMFSADDKYFIVAVKPPRTLRLFDGRTGEVIRDLPLYLQNQSIVRWGYDPQMIVYASGYKLMGYNVMTDSSITLEEFSEQIGDSEGKLCGGDGNDFDDAGEWLLLNMGTRMFAYNVRTGESGPQKDLSGYGVDYCTISPSGNYIVGNTVNGKFLWNRDWTNERNLLSENRHMDMGYMDGMEECLVSRDYGGILYAVRFSDGKKIEILSSDRWFSPMISAVGGSNKEFVYLAMRSHELDPAVEWYRYFGELIKVPLVTEPDTVQRLAHHRCRVPEGGSSFLNQPEAWINHAGDRLFFRSNMDSYTYDGQHDLYMIDLTKKSLDTGNVITYSITAALEDTRWVLSKKDSALAFGLDQGDGGTFWANSIEDVTTRACLFDDTIVFDANGTFHNIKGSDTWLEAWQGVGVDGCGVPIYPHNGSIPATWSLDTSNYTITIQGVGAHLGLAKVYNGGELVSPAQADDITSIQYQVVDLNDQSLTVDISNGTGWWRFEYIKVETSVGTGVDDIDETGVSVKAEMINIHTLDRNIIINIDVASKTLVTDITGRLIAQTYDKKIPVPERGIYIVVVEQENEMPYTKKVFVY